MPPDASPAIQSILATLDLATRFAFVIVVGPDDYPELARWSLAVHLTAIGHEVLWHSLVDSDLDLPALLERAESQNPVVIASGIEALSPEHRHARFARMNLERDVWGQYPVRVVLWCSAEHIDRFQLLAPDLFHWRSLIQPLAAPDLCVFDRTTYLAWLADDCAERSDDRVRRGGHMLLRDPLVIPLEDRNKARGGAIPFSRWVREHRRGLLLRAPTQDPRYPAKHLVRTFALRRVEGDLDSPFPVLVPASQLADLSRMSLSVDPVKWMSQGWTIVAPDDEDAVIFVVDDGSLPADLSSLTTELPRPTWILLAGDGESWWDRLPGWAHAVAMAIIDPLGMGGSADATLQALAALLRELFTPPTLVRFMEFAFGEEFAQRLREAPEERSDDLAATGVRLLLREGGISTELFEALRTLRPRRWQDISRVERMFIELAEQGDPE